MEGPRRNPNRTRVDSRSYQFGHWESHSERAVEACMNFPPPQPSREGGGEHVGARTRPEIGGDNYNSVRKGGDE